MADAGVRFIRVNGRVVPIKSGGSGSSPSGGGKSQKQMSDKKYAEFKKLQNAKENYNKGDIAKSKNELKWSKYTRNAGIALGAAGIVFGHSKSIALGATMGLVGHISSKMDKANIKSAKADKKGADLWNKKYGNKTGV